MTRRDRLRRTGHLCLHSLRNLAFYRAAHEARKVWAGKQFWASSHNNFLDIAVLEWCKVFGDKRAKHYWDKAVLNKHDFFPQLLDHLRLTDDFFDQYILEMRTYRDKFLAHLDEENVMNIPNMTPAIKSAQFLYQWIISKEDDCNAFWDAPDNAVEFFKTFLAEGRSVHAAHTATSQENPSK